MQKIKWENIGIFLLVLGGAFFIDRFIKALLLEFLTNDINLIQDFFTITLQQNIGVAFSIGLPFIIQIILFPVLFIVGLYIVFNYLDFNKLFVQITAGCIAGGALSNFIDRVVLGYVVDYISISIYPVFNLADAFITVGIFFLVLFYGKIKRV